MRFSDESQAYADAITEAIQFVSAQQSRPDLGAVLGALVSVEASFIASVPDARLRKSLRVQLDKERPRILAECLAAGKPAVRVETIAKRVQ